jgi:putative membrane protein
MKTLVIIFLAVSAWGYSSGQDTLKSKQQGSTMVSAGDTSVSSFVTKATKSSVMEIAAGQLAQQKATNAQVKAYGARMIRDHNNASAELKAIATRKNIDMYMMNDSQASSASGNNGSVSSANGNNDSVSSASGNNGSASTASGNKGSVSTSGGNNASVSTSGRDSSNTQTTTRATTGNTYANTTGNNASSQTANMQKNMQQERLSRLQQSTGANFDREYMRMMVEDHTKALLLFQKGASLNDPDIKAYATKNIPIIKEHLQAANTILNSLK